MPSPTVTQIDQETRGKPPTFQEIDEELLPAHDDISDTPSTLNKRPYSFMPYMPSPTVTQIDQETRGKPPTSNNKNDHDQQKSAQKRRVHHLPLPPCDDDIDDTQCSLNKRQNPFMPYMSPPPQIDQETRGKTPTSNNKNDHDQQKCAQKPHVHLPLPPNDGIDDTQCSLYNRQYSFMPYMLSPTTQPSTKNDNLSFRSPADEEIGQFNIISPLFEESMPDVNNNSNVVNITQDATKPFQKQKFKFVKKLFQ